MRKNIFFYFIAFALLAIIFLFFNRDYQELIRYSELTNRTNIIYSSFQTISRQIKNAAILNPDLVKASNSSGVEKLFFTDSQSVVQQLDLLKATVRDSVNIRIAGKLDTMIRSELSWLIKSNVPDSIIQHRSPRHIAALLSIDSVIDLGIQRTGFLLEYCKDKLHDAIDRARVWMILFIILSGILLIYTTTNLLRQKSKRKRKEKELETVFNRINDAVVSVDNAWRYTFLNDAALSTHPLSREETIGKTIWEVHPEMKGTVFWDKYHEAMTTKKVVEVESYYAPMDIWFNVKVYPSADGLTIFYKDFTASKKAEEQLSISEKRFRSIIEQYPSPIIRYTPTGDFITANPAWETMWEDKIENVTGYNILKDPHMESSGMLKYIEKAFGGEVSLSESFEYDPLLIGKKGRKRWIQMLIYPLKDNKGNIIEVVAITLDLTGNREVQEKLISSEKRFRALIENNYDTISLLDESFKIIYRSPSTFRITGFTNEEIENSDAIKNVHPDDIENVRATLRELVANPGKPMNLLYRNLHKNGQYIWLDGVITNLLYDKDVKAIVTNFRDITERVEAEEKLIKSEKIYKTIASSIPDSVICLLDTEYRYLLIEGDMLEKLGYSKNELLGNKAEDVLPADVLADVKKEFERVMEGEIVTSESNRLGYDIISRFIPLMDEANVVYAIMTVAIDVTKLKNAQRNIAELNRGLEEKITQRTAQLESANKELESFSYSVSHDLRAPLRIIDGFGQILTEDYAEKLDEEGRHIIDVMMGSARKMGQLIDDLLNFSKIGRSEMRIAKVNMNELVEEVVRELKNSGIPIPAKLKQHKLKAASGDNALLKQVWVNLISNAIKYSGAKKDPSIEIGMLEKKDEPVYYIKDNGAGFDMQYAGKLFGVFQRFHKEEDFSGTGVGLALVQRIIVRHGGAIWAEAKVNEGATFYFTLPEHNSI